MSTDGSNGIDTYNYATFSRSESAGKSNYFNICRRAGDEAPVSGLPTLDEALMLLQIFYAKKLFLPGFATILCPLLGGGVSPKNDLSRRYRQHGFEFFTIYVREPHPG